MPEYAGLHNSSHPKLMYCNMSGRFLFFFLLLLLAASCAAPRWRREKLAPGLEWRHTRTSRLYQSRQNINVLKVDTRRRQIALAFVTDTVLRTSWLAQADSAALAAVNAGFFKIREGRGSATYLRVRGRTIDDLPAQGYPHLNGALILHEQGAPGIEYAQPNAVYNARPADETILVTGPVLLLQGEEQPLKQISDFVALRHPRTCLCVLPRGRVLLVTVDGRHAEAAGMTLPELTGLLKKLHCRHAINLDGGGSTTLWIRGKPDNGVVNCPSDNRKFDHFGERPCANALLVR